MKKRRSKREGEKEEEKRKRYISIDNNYVLHDCLDQHGEPVRKLPALRTEATEENQTEIGLLHGYSTFG